MKYPVPCNLARESVHKPLCDKRIKELKEFLLNWDYPAKLTGWDMEKACSVVIDTLRTPQPRPTHNQSPFYPSSTPKMTMYFT